MPLVIFCHFSRLNSQVKFMSTCAGNHELKETAACDNIGINETVEFEIVVNAENCPKKPTQTIEIKPVGLDETLTVSRVAISSGASEGMARS